VGLEEGLMPHARSIDERVTDVTLPGPETDGSHSIEEERRLFYVAVTRARDRLYLCRSKQRALRGKPALRTPSRFLDDIPPELVELREALEGPAPEVNATLAGAAGVLAAISFDGSPGSVRRRL
jgi:ATP-dependent DNA helicase Rep